MALPHFAVVDVETSGLNVRRHRLLQLAVVTVDADGSVVDEWDTFVKLRWPLSRVGPTHVHGITRPMLKDAPKVDAVLAEFSERVGDSLFVAHNAEFDGEFLLRAARRSHRPAPEVARLERRLCTLRMSRRLDP
ncbi:3'-5' exonuclease, partial [Ilumatobacter nonamiensis]|uniref:3'-5' exonuclease n=1 Tax=Ilumatobacter nonamiensis TaxID=467093 RepID=UPI0011D21526